MSKIIRNSARCGVCKDEVESTYRHDYRACTCGNVFVDGGRDYRRHGAIDEANYEDTSVVTA